MRSSPPLSICGISGKELVLGVGPGFDTLSREDKKRKAERRVGDHLEIKSGRWLHISRLIDWANNWYSKRITDPATGEPVYEQEHLLTDHRGRGSAKPSKRTTRR